MNDTLQYLLTEEGSIKYAKKRKSSDGSTYYAYEYDYFIKDHQGNVRTVLTEGKDTAIYQATMETANAATEDALFAYVQTPAETRHDKPSGFDSDTDNHKVAMLNGSSAGNKKTGPSLVLKVMAGDKVQMNTYAFYNTTVQQPQSGVSLLADILAILPGAVISNSTGKLAAGNATALGGTLSPNVTQFLNNDRPFDDTRPKAYLNWILFDEQFNYVAGNSGVVQVEAGSEKQALIAPLQTIAKNGFLYIYVSNESPMDVYFDDITVRHYTGPLVQEQSYYPFGLQMSGISSKAVLKALSPFKANGGSEFEDEGSLDYYNTFFRKYDAQIGRFTGVDSKAESFMGLTPFQFGNNNPAMFNDPTGDKYVMIKPAEPMLNTFAMALDYRSSSGGADYHNGMKITSMWDDMMAVIASGGGASTGGGGGDFTAFWEKFLNIAFNGDRDFGKLTADDRAKKDLNELANTVFGAMLLTQLSFSNVPISIQSYPYYDTFYPLDGSHTSDDGKKLVTIYDPTLVFKDGATKSCLVLAHELMHAVDIITVRDINGQNGFGQNANIFSFTASEVNNTRPIISDPGNSNFRTFTEARAIAMQNCIAAEMNLGESYYRWKYGGSDITKYIKQQMYHYADLIETFNNYFK